MTRSTRCGRQRRRASLSSARPGFAMSRKGSSTSNASSPPCRAGRQITYFNGTERTKPRSRLTWPRSDRRTCGEGLRLLLDSWTGGRGSLPAALPQHARRRKGEELCREHSRPYRTAQIYSTLPQRLSGRSCFMQHASANASADRAFFCAPPGPAARMGQTYTAEPRRAHGLVAPDAPP